MEGREYTAVPMVMLTEGVHAGSQGPLLYPADELGKTPQVWNMKPVVVYHPEKNGEGVSACDPEIAENYKIGVIMNTTFDQTGRLKAEAWIEEERANKVDDRVMKAIENQEMMELSTGVYTDQEETPGEYGGEAYNAIARNYRPDHLALLPDKKGACSIEDGAGFIRNSAALNSEQVDILLNYAKGKPDAEENNDDSKDNNAATASSSAIRKGAWAVISGKQKAHEDAAKAHKAASAAFKKDGNDAHSKWHDTKASDHKAWAVEAGAASKTPTKNTLVSALIGNALGQQDISKGDLVKLEQFVSEMCARVLANDVTGDSNFKPDPTQDDDSDDNQDKKRAAGQVSTTGSGEVASSMTGGDAATATATERTNDAMTRKSQSSVAHKGAAIAHRVASSAHRKANDGKGNLMTAYHDTAAKMHDGIAKELSATTNELSFDDTRSALSTALCEKLDCDPMMCSPWVCDVFEDYFVYSYKGELYSHDYSKDNKSVTLEGEPEAVVRVTTYEPATTNDSEESSETTKNMNKKQIIDALIKNHGWEEGERKFLEGLPEKRVRTLHDQATKNAKTTGAGDPSDGGDDEQDDNQEDNRGGEDNGKGGKGAGGKGKRGVGEDPSPDAFKTNRAKRATFNEYLADAPEEVQEILRNARDITSNERKRLCEDILANDANEFTQEELDAFTLPQLRKFAAIATPDRSFGAVRYDGQGEAAPARNSEEGAGEVLDAPVMNFETEKAKVSA
jgi:hypothetical protein